jgi:hypothetical protein
LDVNLLTACRLHTAHKPHLQVLRDLITDYVNQRATLTKQRKVEILEDIMVRLGFWLVHKPPTGTVNNNQRWDSMRDIAQAVGAELQVLKVQGLDGPADWRSIGTTPPGSTVPVRSYWLECLDPDHRSGRFLAPLYQDWLTTGGGMEFWAYVSTHGQATFGQPVPQVKYHGGTRKAQIRIVQFELDNKLHKTHPADTGLFDTQHLSTVASGQGWAIFVMDLDGNLYAHHHKLDTFHHSTFLSGSPVLAAGEIVVEQGEVRVITCKSGHYHPTLQNMIKLVKRLPQLPGDAVIRPEWDQPPKYYRIQDFRSASAGATVLKQGEVLARIPAWARVHQPLINELNTIPV